MLPKVYTGIGFDFRGDSCERYRFVLIEGILYLTKPDEDFVATYIQSKKTWF